MHGISLAWVEIITDVRNIVILSLDVHGAKHCFCRMRDRTNASVIFVVSFYWRICSVPVPRPLVSLCAAVVAVNRPGKPNETTTFYEKM